MPNLSLSDLTDARHNLLLDLLPIYNLLIFLCKNTPEHLYWAEKKKKKKKNQTKSEAL